MEVVRSLAMAALAQLCKGDRAVRDRARLFIDRVKIWETQGNARSVQEVNAGVPAVCAWLANEVYVSIPDPSDSGKMCCSAQS